MSHSPFPPPRPPERKRWPLGVPETIIFAAIAGLVGFLVLALMVGYFVGKTGSYSGAPSQSDAGCDKVRVSKFLAESDALIREFGDHEERANATPRIALGAVIGDMQAARRKYQALDRPTCADEFKQHVDAGMGNVIGQYLSFMASDETNADSSRIRAAQDFGAASRAKARLIEQASGQ